MSMLGLDIGEKRIGVALGTVLAEEYNTITLKPPAPSFLDSAEGTKYALDALLKIIRQERVEKVIAGIPLRSDNTETSQAKKIHEFIDQLKKIADVPIEVVNEALTSFAAEEILRDEGATIEETKQRVDQVSAKLILQQYLEDHL